MGARITSVGQALCVSTSDSKIEVPLQKMVLRTSNAANFGE